MPASLALMPKHSRADGSVQSVARDCWTGLFDTTPRSSDNRESMTVWNQNRTSPSALAVYYPQHLDDSRHKEERKRQQYSRPLTTLVPLVKV